MKKMDMEFKVDIGLEVHVQLLTKAKIFSNASIAYGALPNSQACMIDLAFPGVLPVLNEAVVEKALKLGLALNAKINHISLFDRKQYFYPDLPKGYQLSQFGIPIVGKGYLDIVLEDGKTKRIGITRAHLEEDAGKSLHDAIPNTSGIDLNRAGTGLLEIVSEPDLCSAEEAVAYLKALHELVTYLNICDGNMQEGSFRCDANVSIRPKDSTKLGTRTEIKNVNSFRYVEKAINYEIARHIEVISEGGTIVQETRLYDASTNSTRSMRSKEEATDYRYFPDPDLLPVYVDPAFIESIRQNMPELPWEKLQRFTQQYQLNDYDANVLKANRALADYFEKVVAISKVNPKLVANWVMGELAAALNKNDLTIENSILTPEQLSGLLIRIEDQTISGKMAKIVFEAMWNREGDADEIIAKKGLQQVTDTSALEKLVADILSANPEQVNAYRSGKTKLFGFFVGQAMQATKGQANPQQLNELLKKKLDAEV